MARCEVYVFLTSITHGGDDVGDDWSYLIKVGGQPVRIPMESGRGRTGRNELRRRIGFVYDLECGESVDVELGVWAREHDIISDDVGHDFRTVTVVCPEIPRTGGGATQRLTADVSEWFSGAHQVYFDFSIWAVCHPEN